MSKFWLLITLGCGRINAHALEDQIHTVQYHVREDKSVRNSEAYYRVKGRKQKKVDEEFN